MDFEWDEAKNRANLRKHGFDFADAEEKFRGVLVVETDAREDYGEKRWIGIGAIRGALRTLFSRSASRIPFASSRSERQQSVKANSTKRRSRTDWKRIDAMRDGDIDFSDAPELGPDFFKNAIIWPGPKKQITLRIDPDVLTFFRKHGRGYQSTMNAVLRKYMEARKERQRA
jgi:uncharacterized DUF497 family protein